MRKNETDDQKLSPELKQDVRQVSFKWNWWNKTQNAEVNSPALHTSLWGLGPAEATEQNPKSQGIKFSWKGRHLGAPGQECGPEARGRQGFQSLST